MNKHLLVLLLLAVSLPLSAVGYESLYGQWDIVVDTPIGLKDGSVVMQQGKDGELAGALTLFDKTTPFLEASYDGEVLYFRGKIKFAIFSIPYEATGKLDGDSVVAVADTKMGKMEIVGKRSSKMGK